MDNFSGTNQTQSHRWSALQRVHRQSALAGGSQVALLTRTSYPYPEGQRRTCTAPRGATAAPHTSPTSSQNPGYPAGRRRSQRLTPDE